MNKETVFANWLTCITDVKDGNERFIHFEDIRRTGCFRKFWNDVSVDRLGPTNGDSRWTQSWADLLIGAASVLNEGDGKPNG